jgi:hypothetical protein
MCGTGMATPRYAERLVCPARWNVAFLLIALAAASACGSGMQRTEQSTKADGGAVQLSSGSSANAMPVALKPLIAAFTVRAGLNGEPNPRIGCVVTTAAAASALLNDDPSHVSTDPTMGDQSALLIVGTGAFDGAMEKLAPGTQPVKGSVMFEVVRTDTGQIMLWGIRNSPVSLGSLGRVLNP